MTKSFKTKSSYRFRWCKFSRYKSTALIISIISILLVSACGLKTSLVTKSPNPSLQQFARVTSKPTEFDKIRGVQSSYGECPDGGDFGFQCQGTDLGTYDWSKKQFIVSEELYNRDLAQFKNDIPRIKSLGFNTIWLMNWWVHFQPQALPQPVYDGRAFSHLKAKLQLLHEAGLRAILPLNYMLSSPLIPNGIEYQDFILKQTQFNAFVQYVEHYLGEIKDYAGDVYILFFTEGMEPSSFNSLDWAQKNQKTAEALQSTIGNIPSLLSKEISAAFTFGYHDYSLISQNWAPNSLPFNRAQFSFFSGVFYPPFGWADYEKAKGGLYMNNPVEAEASYRRELLTRVSYIKNHLPDFPFIFGEYGETQCYLSDESNDWQNWMVSTQLKIFSENKIGSSLWGWTALRGTRKDGTPFDCDPTTRFAGDMRGTGSSFGLTKPDGSLRPTALALAKLLGGTPASGELLGAKVPTAALLGARFEVQCNFQTMIPCAYAQIENEGGCDFLRWENTAAVFSCRSNSNGSKPIECGTSSFIDKTCSDSKYITGSINIGDAPTVSCADPTQDLLLNRAAKGDEFAVRLTLKKNLKLSAREWHRRRNDSRDAFICSDTDLLPGGFCESLTAEQFLNRLYEVVKEKRLSSDYFEDPRLPPLNISRANVRSLLRERAARGDASAVSKVDFLGYDLASATKWHALRQDGRDPFVCSPQDLEPFGSCNSMSASGFIEKLEQILKSSRPSYSLQYTPNLAPQDYCLFR